MTNPSDPITTRTTITVLGVIRRGGAAVKLNDSIGQNPWDLADEARSCQRVEVSPRDVGRDV